MVDTQIKDNIELSSKNFANGDTYDFGTMSKQLIAMKEMAEDGIVSSFGIPDYKDLTSEKTLFELGINVTQGEADEIVNPDFAQVGDLRITSVNGEELDAAELGEKIDDIIDTFNSVKGKDATAFKAAMAIALTANHEESLANAVRGPTV